MNVTMGTKLAYNSMDVAKMAAAVFVVAIHSQPFTGLTKDIVIDVFARLAVPFFFMASAFLFFRKPADGNRVRGYVRRLGLLYLFWFVVELPMTVLHGFIEPDRPFLINLLYLFRGFLFGSTFGGSWFLMALIECIPLIWFLSRYLRNSVLAAIGVLFFAVSVTFSYYFAFLPEPVQAVAAGYKSVMGSIQNSWVLAFGFCVVGKIAGEHSARLVGYRPHWLPAVLVLACILSTVEVLAVKSVQDPNSTDIFFMLLPFSVLFFLFVMTRNISWNINYVRIRNYSTIFYLSHFIYVFFLVVINKHIIHINPILKYAIVLTLCYITSRVMTTLSAKKWWGWLRYGY